MISLNDLGIGGKNPCFIIAEIGQNHQGNIELAKKLVATAKECGADCVKFQKSCLSEKFTRDALDAPYDIENSFGKTYGEHKAHLEFSDAEYMELQAYSKEVGVMFTASAMDMVSADFLDSLGVPFIKIGSGDTNNFLLVEHVARMKKPIILSTGMQELDTVKKAAKIVFNHHKELALLHCVSAYPTPFQDVNLSIIELYRKEFEGIPIGYSGHELGIAVSIAAVALGAKVIERHFTLDKGMKGTDHKCSLDPSEFKQMVQGVREVEAAIGTPNKRILQTEVPCWQKLGKSIVAKNDIPEGTMLSAEYIVIKVSQPKGARPEQMYNLIGKITSKHIKKDTPIRPEDLMI